MTGQEGKYNIKAVSKMLGIQPGTLRAWERRYQFISPIRSDAGHRLYTEEHIKILNWLINKVNQGFTISQAVTLFEKSQDHFAIGFLPDISQIGNLTDELLNALLDFNELKAQEMIDSLFSLYSIDKVIYEVFNKLLEKIGQLWEEGKISVGHEHFATLIIRNKLASIFHSLPKNIYFPKVVAVCGPGEIHDIGLLMFAIYLRQRGFDVVYLGTGIPEEDLEAVIKTVHPHFLFISCSIPENLTMILSLVTQFSLNYTKLKIGLGGKAVNSMKKSEKEQFSAFLTGQTPPEWSKWLPNQT